MYIRFIFQVFICCVLSAGTVFLYADEKKETSAADVKQERTETGVQKQKNSPETENSRKETDSKKEAAAAEDARKASWIKDTINFGIQKERREAAGMIPSIKTPAVRQELHDMLTETLKTETNTDMKVKILTVLGDMKLPGGEEEIISMTGDESEDVAASAVYALKEKGTVSAAPVMLEKLKSRKLDEDSRLTSGLISALASFRYAEGLPYIKEHISDTSAVQSVREQLTIYAGSLSSPEAEEILLKLYKDEDEEIMIRCFAVNGLSKNGTGSFGKDINEVLAVIDAYPFKKRQRYYSLVLYSVTALVKAGDSSAVPRLLDSLKSDNASVRLRAAELIGETGDKRTIDILKYKMNHDSDSKVRKAAENALKKLEASPGKDKSGTETGVKTESQKDSSAQESQTEKSQKTEAEKK